MSEKDIVERLQEAASGDSAGFGLLQDAADAIKVLRYDHARDVEKIAALSREIEQLRSLAGAADVGESYRALIKDLPRWPRVGTHE